MPAAINPTIRNKKRPGICQVFPRFYRLGNANTAYDLPENKIIMLRTRNGEKTNGNTK